MAIFQDFNLEVGKKWQKQAHAQKFLTNAQSVILTTEISSLISDKVSEMTDFNGLCNGNIRSVRNYWLIKPVWTGLNQFVHSGQKLLIGKKGVVEQNYKFLWFPAQLHLNIIC